MKELEILKAQLCVKYNLPLPKQEERKNSSNNLMTTSVPQQSPMTSFPSAPPMENALASSNQPPPPYNANHQVIYNSNAYTYPYTNNRPNQWSVIPIYVFLDSINAADHVKVLSVQSL